MRNLIAGVMLGVLLTMFPTWLEKHKMDDYIDIAMGILIAGIVTILLWRWILDALWYLWPELWERINRLSQHKAHDEVFEQRLAERRNHRKTRRSKKG